MATRPVRRVLVDGSGTAAGSSGGRRGRRRPGGGIGGGAGCGEGRRRRRPARRRRCWRRARAPNGTDPAPPASGSTPPRRCWPRSTVRSSVRSSSCRARWSTARGPTTRCRSARTRCCARTPAPPTRRRRPSWNGSPRRSASSHPDVAIALLRPTVTTSNDPDAVDWMGRSLWHVATARHGDADPVGQFLHIDDLGAAIDHVAPSRSDGAFNVAPEGWLSASRRSSSSVAAAGSGSPPPAPAASPRSVGDFGLTSTPPEVLPFTMHSWVVASDRLRGDRMVTTLVERGGVRGGQSAGVVGIAERPPATGAVARPALRRRRGGLAGIVAGVLRRILRAAVESVRQAGAVEHGPELHGRPVAQHDDRHPLTGRESGHQRVELGDVRNDDAADPTTRSPGRSPAFLAAPSASHAVTRTPPIVSWPVRSSDALTPIEVSMAVRGGGNGRCWR